MRKTAAGSKKLDRRPACLVLAAVGVLVGAGLVACASGAPTNEVRTDGPIQAGPPHGFAISRPVGAEFTDGFEVLYVDGSVPAQIESVDFVGAEGLELLGAYVVGEAREVAAVQVLDAWPPSPASFGVEHLDEAIGSTLAPASRTSRGTELLLGIRVVGPGVARRDALEVGYRVGDESFLVTIPAQLTVCTDPGQEVRGHCRAR